MTTANELGLTTAVPARIEVLVDARLKPIALGHQEIHFRYVAPICTRPKLVVGLRPVQSLAGCLDAALFGPDQDRRDEIADEAADQQPGDDGQHDACRTD